MALKGHGGQHGAALRATSSWLPSVSTEIRLSAPVLAQASA